jgi:signal transduction histidine kinase
MMQGKDLALFAKTIWIRERPWMSYGISVLACLTGLLARLALGRHLAGAPFLSFIPAIVVASMAGGRGPGILAVAISAVLADYFFILPIDFTQLWPNGWVIMIAFFIITSTIVVAVDAAMTSTLHLTRATQSLRAANDNLEARIAERTAELMAAQATLRQAQKMEAIGQLTGGIAHDFNNLLTSIGGSLELLQTRLREGRLTELQRYATAAQDSAQRAATLTQRLLAFSRNQALTPCATDINALVGGMTELIRHSIDPGITLHVTAFPQLWTTLVDPNQLEHALLNLCINASDAMPEGGRLTLETANQTITQSPGLAPGDYATLTVRDTGTGMPPEVAERAFEPFFTTKPVGQGTGLGLSMIYGFVRQSGGEVRIQSALGQGTAVQLYLPRHAGPAERPTPASPALPQASICGATILVIDDESTIRMLIADQLEDMGHASMQGADGQSGLRILESAQHIDLLITDIGLPGAMNGRQLADAARDLRPDLKILFITGYSGDNTIPAAQLAPGTHVLTKPFAMAALGARIQDLLAAP